MAGSLLLPQEGNLDSKCGALHVQVQRKVCGASTFFGHVLGLRLKDVGAWLALWHMSQALCGFGF